MVIPFRVACPRLRGHVIVRPWAPAYAHEGVGLPPENVGSDRNSGCTKPNGKGATCGRDHERLAGGHRFRHRRSGGTLGLGATAPSRPSRAQPRRVPDDRIPRPPPRRSRTPGPDRPHRPRPHRRARRTGRPAPRRVPRRYRRLADPDAKTVPYRSCHDGVMHACGHDAHATMALAAALALWKSRDAFPTPISWRAIFQPAEEVERGRRRDDRGRCASRMCARSWRCTSIPS